ncbi:MAG: ankyrin repeat domain-containing protein [Usitatibacteraceae bacterium]
MSHEFSHLFELLKSGSIEQLDEVARHTPGFPEGVDSFIGRRWIVNAIDSGSTATIKWMLRKGVDLNFRDQEGYTPLHTAIERLGANRHEVLELLLRAGAPVNIKGINDWTPAHIAAARDDVESLKLLVLFGADLTIRTDIDDYATPLEEARNLGKTNACRYLESAL